MTEKHTPQPHSKSPPMDWIAERAGTALQGQTVLDLACGGGRHGRVFLARGCRVTFVDIETAGVSDLQKSEACTILQADLENGPWPLAGRRFDVVIVTNYLWRPLLPKILDSVADGGTLLYQTFALGNERFGRPRNPDFLLKPGELENLAKTAALTVIDFFEGEVSEPKPAVIQRLHAKKPD